MKFRVTRDRAYWVRETQDVDTNSSREAENVFYDQFDPTLEIREVLNDHGNQHATPLVVTRIREAE